jgi:hypothetical protein
MSEPDNSQQKQGGGRFQPGQSGNPRGKPKGLRSRVTQLAENLMSEDAEEVVKAVVSAAKGGDMAAARIILDRICPTRKSRPVEIDIPPIAALADVLPAMGKVVAAMASGDLTPDEAATIAGLLDAKRKTLETIEIERRIAALEQRAGEKK